MNNREAHRGGGRIDRRHARRPGGRRHGQHEHPRIRLRSCWAVSVLPAQPVPAPAPQQASPQAPQPQASRASPFRVQQLQLPVPAAARGGLQRGERSIYELSGPTLSTGEQFSFDGGIYTIVNANPTAGSMLLNTINFGPTVFVGTGYLC
jgi:hypothetical protein